MNGPSPCPPWPGGHQFQRWVSCRFTSLLPATRCYPPVLLTKTCLACSLFQISLESMVVYCPRRDCHESPWARKWLDGLKDVLRQHGVPLFIRVRIMERVCGFKEKGAAKAAVGPPGPKTSFSWIGALAFLGPVFPNPGEAWRQRPLWKGKPACQEPAIGLY